MWYIHRYSTSTHHAKNMGVRNPPPHASKHHQDHQYIFTNSRCAQGNTRIAPDVAAERQRGKNGKTSHAGNELLNE